MAPAFRIQNRAPAFLAAALRPVLGVLLGATLGVSCATGPTFPKYPEREVQRSPLLPEGVGAWKPFAAHAFDSDGHTYAYPVVWEQGVSDDLTVIWMPLPLAVRLRAWKHLSVEAQMLGALQTRERDFDWRPSVETLWKEPATGDWGWEAGLGLQAEIRRVRQENFGLTLWGRAAVTWQARQRLWLRGAAVPWVERGEVRANYPGLVPEDGTLSAAEPRIPRFRLPLELELGVEPHPQWLLTLRFRLLSLGFPAGYTSVPGFLGVTYLW